MKFTLQNIALFVLFAFAFSALTGCTGSTPPANNTGNTTAGNTTAGATPADSKGSQFPPMPSGIMQSEIKMVDGTTIKLGDKKGKVLLINLWATWCGPCRSEMPHLVEMQDAYRDKGFEVLGLDVDPESVEDVNAFAKEMKLNYALGWTGDTLRDDLARLGKFEGIPQSFLVDREGRLRGVFLGGSKKVVTSMKETVEKLIVE